MSVCSVCLSMQMIAILVLKAGFHLACMQVARGAESNENFVSLLRLKDVARKLLPADSITRNVIIAEPDTLPLAEAIAKFKVFDSLLLEELGSARRPR